jgi:hypothetical protein
VPAEVLFEVTRRFGFGALSVESVALNGSGGPMKQINFLALCVDETDVNFWGSTTFDAYTTPATAAPTLTGTSRFKKSLLKTAITNGGTGYTADFDVIVSGDGVGCVVRAKVSGGAVTALEIRSRGILYSTMSFAFTNGDGTGAAATATLSCWLPGDYIVWNGGGYEIDQITAFDGTNMTFARGKFGSAMEAQTGVFFRVQPRGFIYSVPVRQNAAGSESPNTQSGIPEAMPPFLCPFQCVLAVQSQAISDAGPGPARVLNLSHAADTDPAPGLRTLGGNEYNLGITGALSVGKTADFRVKVRANEAIHVGLGELNTAATGETGGYAVEVCLAFITEGGIHAGLIDKLRFAGSSRYSYPTDGSLDERQMPYHTDWTPTTAMGPQNWPTNLLPEMVSALSGGKLVTGFSIDPDGTVVFAKDGFLDLIVTQIGSTDPGTDLVVTVQT